MRRGTTPAITLTVDADLTAYGVYVNSASVSSSTLSLTINGTYTARVYGVKLIDLIGG